MYGEEEEMVIQKSDLHRNNSNKVRGFALLFCKIFILTGMETYYFAFCVKYHVPFRITNLKDRDRLRKHNLIYQKQY